jgi:hypothetical protein
MIFYRVLHQVFRRQFSTIASKSGKNSQIVMIFAGTVRIDLSYISLAEPKQVSTPNFGTMEHEDLTPEQFQTRWVDFFDHVSEEFELHRGLNNLFAYDLVPIQPITESALKAARRLNDYPTTLRILNALKVKISNATQYQHYVTTIQPTLDELGVDTPDQLKLEQRLSSA